jgi:hypothetical protein
MPMKVILKNCTETMFAIPLMGSIFCIGIGIAMICVFWGNLLAEVISGFALISFGIWGVWYALKELSIPRTPRR